MKTLSATCLLAASLACSVFAAETPIDCHIFFGGTNTVQVEYKFG
jgi:hypothetical protein